MPDIIKKFSSLKNTIVMENALNSINMRKPISPEIDSHLSAVL